MKRLVIWIIEIVAIVIALDLLFGGLFSLYINKLGLKGDYENSENIFRNYHSDIVILGSSVALNSINPTTLHDSLGVDAISGGANGQAFPFYLTSLKAVIAQHKPKTVILGMLPSNLSDTGIGSRYNYLAPYYGLGFSDIDENLDNAYGQTLMKSNFYRLNNIWFRILLYNFMTSGVQGENGFVGKPVRDIFPEMRHVDASDTHPMTTERREQLTEFLKICKDNNIRLMVLFTPTLCDVPDGFVNPVVTETAELCLQFGAEFYDDSKFMPLSADNTMFYDNNHLNLRGSDIYTDTIIKRLR